MPQAYHIEKVAKELRPLIKQTPPVNFENITKARLGIKLMHLFMPKVNTKGIFIETYKIPSVTDSHHIRVRQYTPKPREKKQRPAMVFMHWGGFVVGGLKTEHRRCVRLCQEFGMIILSVDYRLAPENPFPRGLDDCYSALIWLNENAVNLGVDKTRIAVGGTSAVGGLAASLALKVKKEAGPKIALQYLGFPVLDSSCSTPSAIIYTDTPNWTSEANRLMWRYYLNASIRLK